MKSNFRFSLNIFIRINFSHVKMNFKKSLYATRTKKGNTMALL